VKGLGTTLYMLQDMQIFIKGRRLIAVDVEPSDTVCMLKTRIHDREGIPPRYLLLTHACKILENERTLESYGIERESTIEYRVRAFVDWSATPNDPPAPE
jgi:ubiquitin C